MERWKSAVHGTSQERGASLVEYALLVALIALACFAMLVYFGSATGDDLSRVADSVSAA